MASINVEFSAFTDPRFKILGKLLGTNYFDALGRCEAVWMYCIERGTNLVPDVVLNIVTEVDTFTDHMIAADLAERDHDGKIRIKGTQGRINYLSEARERQKVATAAAKAKKESDAKKLEIRRKKRAEHKRSKEGAPKLEPKLEPTIDPLLVSSSTSSSSSASAFSSSSALREKQKKEEELIHIGLSPQTEPIKFDFESLYELYPKRKGSQRKVDGLAHCRKHIKTLVDYDNFRLAIKNYNAHLIAENKIGTEFVCQFRTFAGKIWQEWINPPDVSSYGKSESKNVVDHNLTTYNQWFNRRLLREVGNE